MNITIKSTLVFLSLIAGACRTSAPDTPADGSDVFLQARQNGLLAREGYARCNDYMNSWLSFADPGSKLVPRTLDKDRDIWNANDCAADNFPFLVLTSYFTDQEKYNGVMREMLDNEIRLTSRVKSLPDTYSFSKRGFLFDSVSMARVVFGTTEYIKDGLLPVTEWLGQSPWSERMITMLDDLDEHIDVAGGFGRNMFGNAPDDEVNGELLQILSRVYWMTGKEKYLDWAVKIGDHFLGPSYPLDAHYLRLRDHGCEIVSGLCELYVALHYAEGKDRINKDRLTALLDFILDHARNEDGLFFNAIDPQKREAVDTSLADTWGYTLNGFYAVYMIDSIVAYRNAVDKVFANLHKYRNYNWENLGADGYADAIEGALNLLNRVPDDRAASWIDSEIKVMWSMQDSAHRESARKWQNSGIIEGWYGDGNFARTTLMYNLWKSGGTWLQPWRADVALGGVMRGDTLYLSISSELPWDGKIFFDTRRHAVNLKLPMDWPRINQFPEWFTISAENSYSVYEDGKVRTVSGASMKEGIDVQLGANEIKRLMVSGIKAR